MPHSLVLIIGGILIAGGLGVGAMFLPPVLDRSLHERGARDITCVTLLAAPEGLKAMEERIDPSIDLFFPPSDASSMMFEAAETALLIISASSGGGLAGGFGGRYSGRTSSVLDVALRDGDPTRLRSGPRRGRCSWTS